MMTGRASIRAVVFDRDGVLTRFDTARLGAFFAGVVPLPLPEIARRWTMHCETSRTPASAEEETRFWAAFWDGISESVRLPSEARGRLREFDYTEYMSAFEDAQPALDEVRRRGLRTGVLSNFPLASLQASLEAVGLAGGVDAACSASVIGAAKPSRAAYEAIALRLGVSPHECLMLDDEEACVEGARQAGMLAYLVDRTRQGDDLEQGAVHTLDGVAARLDAVGAGR